MKPQESKTVVIPKMMSVILTQEALVRAAPAKHGGRLHTEFLLGAAQNELLPSIGPKVSSA